MPTDGRRDFSWRGLSDKTSPSGGMGWLRAGVSLGLLLAGVNDLLGAGENALRGCVCVS